jgi:hypothetical protein
MGVRRSPGKRPGPRSPEVLSEAALLNALSDLGHPVAAYAPGADGRAGACLDQPSRHLQRRSRRDVVESSPRFPPRPDQYECGPRGTIRSR